MSFSLSVKIHRLLIKLQTKTHWLLFTANEPKKQISTTNNIQVKVNYENYIVSPIKDPDIFSYILSKNSQTSQDLNQPLITTDLFNMVDSQLLLMLRRESPNLIISRLHCWADKLKLIIKRSEVDSLHLCSLTALHA